jgi:hypothetical protein
VFTDPLPFADSPIAQQRLYKLQYTYNEYLNKKINKFQSTFGVVLRRLKRKNRKE